MSNLSKRVIAGIFGIPVLIFASYKGGIYLIVLTLILNSIALWEFCSMFEKKEIFPMKILTVITADIILILPAGFPGFANSFYLFFYYILISALTFSSAEIFRKEKRSPLNPAISVFGIVYITFPFIMINFLQSLSFQMIIVFMFILIWTCDSAAYFGGRFFGKRKLSEISPNKTIEGSVAGFVFTIIVSLILHFIFPDEINLTDAVVIGILTGIFSQTGDLFESLIKRYCGVKDSSLIIPGHGGILDRFDSLLFVTPAVVIYFIAQKFI
ncbi:MAG: phosphatidate cytidylyltransferase [Ignavibacteria bacterium]|nr:phosphatidate cytidylyltransferase [Ignavibacteria bacterium]